MHLLYVDESGTIADPTQRYFVLCGVSVFERVTHWVEQELNQVAAQFSQNDPHAVELHGSPMRGGRDAWRAFPLPQRIQAITDALDRGLAGYVGRGVNLFAVVIEKAALPGTDPVEHAFECLTTRFDLFLKRLYTKHNDPQRGIMVFDKSSTEARIQTLAREFKYQGHSMGRTRNYAEVPVFLDSRASRLIQLADLASFAIYRKFEHSDDQLFNHIKNCFDSEGGVNHGLVTFLRPAAAPQGARGT